MVRNIIIVSSNCQTKCAYKISTDFSENSTLLVWALWCIYSETVSLSVIILLNHATGCWVGKSHECVFGTRVSAKNNYFSTSTSFKIKFSERRIATTFIHKTKLKRTKTLPNDETFLECLYIPFRWSVENENKSNKKHFFFSFFIHSNFLSAHHIKKCLRLELTYKTSRLFFMLKPKL